MSISQWLKMSGTNRSFPDDKSDEAGSMFESFKTLIAGGLEEPNLNRSCRLAAAALLVRVATVDRAMSAARHAKLHAVLRSCFGLDDPDTVRLIEDATAVEQSALDLYRFTRKLIELLGEKGRRQIVKMMWEVVYADGGVNECESNVIWRAADLLGVSSRCRIELRQQIAAAGAALAPA
jgi:uncharacterized tellurite resistance protein B-like protein